VFDRYIIFVQRLLGGLAFQYFDFSDGYCRNAGADPNWKKYDFLA